MRAMSSRATTRAAGRAFARGPRSAPLALALTCAVALTATPIDAPSGTARAQSRPDAPLAFDVASVPVGARSDAPLPMVLALHDGGQSPEQMRAAWGSFGASARIVHVRAPLVRGRAWEWFWDRPAGAPPVVTSRRARELVPRIAATLADARSAHPTLGRAIVVGLGDGGVLAYALAVLDPDDVAAAFPIAGFLPAPLLAHVPVEPGRVPPIVAFHGAEDRRSPVEADRTSLRALRACGVRAALRTYAGVGEAPSEIMRMHVTISVRHAVERERTRAIDRGGARPLTATTALAR